nr:DUF4179 domain-containing protein [Sedimentibacter sp.]
MRGQTIFEAIDLVKNQYIDEVYNSDIYKVKEFSKKKMIVLMLAATLIIALLTACAAEIFEWEGRLSQLLNLTSEQEKHVDGMWCSINKTQTKNDITVTLDSALVDDSSMYVLYDIVLKDDMDMSRNYYFDIEQVDGQNWYSYGGSLSGGWGSRIVNVDEDKHIITCMMTYTATSGKIKDQKMRFWFHNLYSYIIEDDAVADKRLEQDVNFVFYADVTSTPNKLNYTIDKNVSGIINTVNLKKIVVTPLSITVSGNSENRYHLKNDSKVHETDFVRAVILKDGTLINSSGSYLSSSVSGNISYKAMFDDVINPEDVSEIEFYDRNTVSLSDFKYTIGSEDDYTISQIADKVFSFSIILSIICMAFNSASMLYFCKNDIYLSFEKVEEKQQKKGRKYTFDDFCSKYKRELLICEKIYTFYIVLLIAGVFWLNYLIIINWFVTMTVFIDVVCVCLIFLLLTTIKASRKTRRYLE